MPFAVPSMPVRARLAGLATLTVLSAAIAVAMPDAARAEPAKAAVFPVELLDPGVVGGRRARPDETRKLALVTDELKAALAKQGGLEAVDTAPQAAEIAKQAPLYKCADCAGPIARTLGADLAVTGYVEKGSNQIFNLYVRILDAASGKPVRAGQVVIRADTDDTWAHAMRWVVKNRLLAEPLPGKS